MTATTAPPTPKSVKKQVAGFAWNHKPKLSTIFWAIDHTFALAVIWLELELIAAAYLWAYNTERIWALAAITLFVINARKHIGDELRGNMRDTYNRWFRFLWRTRTPEKWGSTDKDWPALVALEFGEFVGWWATLGTLFRKTIPFTSVTFTVRRPNNKGHTKGADDSWLVETADLLKRRFDYTLAAPRPHPDDPNRDLIELRSQVMPDLIEAE